MREINIPESLKEQIIEMRNMAGISIEPAKTTHDRLHSFLSGEPNDQLQKVMNVCMKAYKPYMTVSPLMLQSYGVAMYCLPECNDTELLKIAKEIYETLSHM